MIMQRRRADGIAADEARRLLISSADRVSSPRWRVFWALVASTVAAESLHLLLSAFVWAHGGATPDLLGPAYRPVTWSSALQPLALAAGGVTMVGWLLRPLSVRSSVERAGPVRAAAALLTAAAAGLTVPAAVYAAVGIVLDVARGWGGVPAQAYAAAAALVVTPIVLAGACLVLHRRPPSVSASALHGSGPVPVFSGVCLVAALGRAASLPGTTPGTASVAAWVAGLSSVLLGGGLLIRAVVSRAHRHGAGGPVETAARPAVRREFLGVVTLAAAVGAAFLAVPWAGHDDLVDLTPPPQLLISVPGPDLGLRPGQDTLGGALHTVVVAAVAGRPDGFVAAAVIVLLTALAPTLLAAALHHDGRPGHGSLARCLVRGVTAVGLVGTSVLLLGSMALLVASLLMGSRSIAAATTVGVAAAAWIARLRKNGGITPSHVRGLLVVVALCGAATMVGALVIAVDRRSDTVLASVTWYLGLAVLPLVTAGAMASAGRASGLGPAARARVMAFALLPTSSLMLQEEARRWYDAQPEEAGLPSQLAVRWFGAHAWGVTVPWVMAVAAAVTAACVLKTLHDSGVGPARSGLPA